jgi:hypothetical protein
MAILLDTVIKVLAIEMQIIGSIELTMGVCGI